ncbi:MAG: TolC family protein [Candidatus Latescibacteria bacterium]|nr:TolC family protein [Candidatus Latescibacterota bacterium]
MALALSVSASAACAQERGLSLESAVRLALERNERARIAEAHAAAAGARASSVRTFFLPDLTLIGNYTRRAYQTLQTVRGETAVFQHYNALSSTATVTMDLFDARLFPLYRQVTQEREAARLTASNDKRLLAFDAAEAYLTALSTEQVFEAAQRRLDFARASLKDARARFEAQIVSSNDVTRAELELATAEREGTGAQGDVKTTRLSLGYLLDTDVDGPLQTPAALLQAATEAPGIADDLIAQAQKQRPDVAASRRRAEALRASAREPLFRMFPTLTLAGLYRNTNETGVTGHRHDGNASLALGWNLFDGGRGRAERAERLALARAADLDLQASERRLALEVRSALVALSNRQAVIRQASVAVEVAQKNARQTAELYRQGLVNALQVADANVGLFEAEVALASARYGLALAYLDLRAATGLGPIGEESTP